MVDHPRISQDWFSTTLLRWAEEGLVVYDRWVVNFSGVSAWQGAGGEVLLDFYYFCYLIAFVGVLFWFWKFRREGWIKVKSHVPYDAMLLAMIGVLVGAKTAYIFIYNPDFYFGPPPYGPVDTADQLRRIFLNWSGMASHGAAAGLVAVSFAWYFYSGRKLPVAHIGDIGGISGAFGAIWIRLANFMNGELYGREAAEWLPWAMRFPVNSGKGNPVVSFGGELYERMPVPEDPAHAEVWLAALRESNPGGVIEAGEYVLFKNPDAYRQGYELLYRGADGVQTFAPDAVPFEFAFRYLEVITTPRHPSQLYQMLLEGVLLLILLLWMRKRVKRAGMIVGAFFAGYPIARFIGEFFRQPDVQFQSEGNELGTVMFGLSMGQFLSLGMAAFGVGLMLYFWRFGRVIADIPMYPADEDKADSDEEVEKKLHVPFEKSAGGSSGAGDIAGFSELRKSLAQQEAEGAEQTDDDAEDEPDAEQPRRAQTPPPLNARLKDIADGGSGAGDIAGLPELREELSRRNDNDQDAEQDPEAEPTDGDKP